MDLGHRDTHSDVLILLPHHWPIKRKLCTPSHTRQFSSISPNHHWCARSIPAHAGSYSVCSGYFPKLSPTGDGYQQDESNQMHHHFGFQLVTLICASRLGTRTSSANTYAAEPLMLLGSSCYPDALNTECSLWLSRDDRRAVFLGCDTCS